MLIAPAGPPNNAPPNAPKPAAAPIPLVKLVPGSASAIPTLDANLPPPSSTLSLKASPNAPLTIPPVVGKPLPTNARSIVVPPGKNAEPILIPAASKAATLALDKAIPLACSSLIPCFLSCG